MIALRICHHEKTTSAAKNLPALPAAIYLAKKMGEGVA